MLRINWTIGGNLAVNAHAVIAILNLNYINITILQSSVIKLSNDLHCNSYEYTVIFKQFISIIGGLTANQKYQWTPIL